MEGPLTEAEPLLSSGSISQEVSKEAQPTSGSISQCVPQMKDETQSQVSCDPTIETKPESSSSTREVKAEQEKSKSKGGECNLCERRERAPEPDSEDSFTPERVVAAVQRLLETRESGASASAQPYEERETNPSPEASRERELLCWMPLESKGMVPTLHKGQDVREGGIAHQIRSCLAPLSS